MILTVEYPVMMASVDRSIVAGFIPALKREAFALNFSKPVDVAFQTNTPST